MATLRRDSVALPIISARSPKPSPDERVFSSHVRKCSDALRILLEIFPRSLGAFSLRSAVCRIKSEPVPPPARREVSVTAARIQSPVAVLKYPSKHGDLLPFARMILNSMTGNASSPAAGALLATLTAAIAAFDEALAAAMTRAKGTAETRDAKRS